MGVWKDESSQNALVSGDLVGTTGVLGFPDFLSLRELIYER